MKHLKTINEMFDDSTKSIKDFIESHLSYLIDDGFKIDYGISEDILYPRQLRIILSNDKNSSATKIIGYKNEFGDNQRFRADMFSWKDISDSFVPLLNILNSEFPISKIGIRRSNDHSAYYPVSILNNENRFTYDDILSIELYISIDSYNKLLSSRWNDGVGFIIIHNDDKHYILREKNIHSSNRIYYILIKRLAKDHPFRIIKVSYDLDNKPKSFFDGFLIFDNYNRLINFNLLQNSLNKNGVDYGEFNSAWYYIENDHNR